MKEKPNYAELETRIDFKTLAGRIDQLSEKDNPQRKTVFTLLDKLREPILAARRNRRVSYRVLANELRQAGLQVSEPTLRKYMQAQGVVKKPRKPGKHSIESAPKLPPQSFDGKGSVGKPVTPTVNTAQKPGVPSRQHRFNLDI